MKKHTHKHFGYPGTVIGECRGGKMIYVPTHNIVLFTTQRAASTSMHESLAPMDSKNDNRYVKQGEAAQLIAKGAQGIMFIRNPFERFASANDIFGKRFCCPESFADYAIRNFNSHWSPMMAVHCGPKGFLPTRVFAFDNLAEQWGLLMPKYPLLSRNRSFQRSRYVDPQTGHKERGRMSWGMLSQLLSVSTLNRLAEHYSEDIKVHGWCLDYNEMELV